MAYYTRKHWTSTANRGPRFKRPQVHATLHYPGWGTDSIRTAGWDLDRCFRQLRAWRNLHVGGGAYSEIAYNLFALPTGDVAEGRGNRQNGANGTSTSNRAGMSVQVVIGDNEPLSMGHLQAICAALSLLERWHPGITRRQYGHRHWVSTRCPGPHVMDGLPYPLHGTPADGGGAGIIGTAPGLSDGLADVDDSQRWLDALGYESGPIDGIFGPRTEAATRAFQSDFDITPVDGRPGPATRTILEEAVSTIDDIKAIVTQNQVEIRSLPGKVLDEPIALAGMHEGTTSSARTKLAWQGHNFTQAHQMIAALQGELAGLQQALKAIDAGEPLDLEQVRAAAQDGVSQALTAVEADVRLTIQGD